MRACPKVFRGLRVLVLVLAFPIIGGMWIIGWTLITLPSTNKKKKGNQPKQRKLLEVNQKC